MLEHVALGQTRFRVPGLAPDARGVALGRQGAFLLASIDQVVAFFRVLSHEQALDDLLPTLKIAKVRSPVAALQIVVTFDVGSSYLMDRAARAVRLCGGLAFTGSGKHYVKWRDDRSPFGYDAELVTRDGGDVVLYADDFSSAYERTGELGFGQLVMRLAPERLDARSVREAATEMLYLMVARGLGEAMVRYLVRARVRAEVTQVEPKDSGAFRADRGGFLLVRVAELPKRMVDLFRAVPGVELYAPVAENVAVELGWRHPVHLASCASLFPRDRFFLFSGGRRAVDVVPGPLELTPAENLTKVRFLGEGTVRQGGATARPAELEVTIRLSPSSDPPSNVVGALVPWAQAAWLKKLVYALPPAALRGHRAALLEAGILILANAGVDALPLGQLLRSLGSGILVPVGFEPSPRVSPEVLAERLGVGAGTLTIFALGFPKPLSVEEAKLLPLERRLLLDVAVVKPIYDARHAAAEAAAAPEVANDPLSSFVLWGFRPDAERKQLPPPAPDPDPDPDDDGKQKP